MQLDMFPDCLAAATAADEEARCRTLIELDLARLADELAAIQRRKARTDEALPSRLPALLRALADVEAALRGMDPSGALQRQLAGGLQ
jgi:hypothetical protein